MVEELKMRKICFVGTDNYPVLNPSMGNAQIGGESVQQTLLAREFARSGYDVSMIVKDHGQPDGEVIDGIKVFKTYAPTAGVPVLRFIHPRATSIFRALRAADADVYYQSCASVHTGYVAWHSRRNKRRFVFRVASDSDCMPGKQLIGFWRDRQLYEYGLKRADLILVQTHYQLELLERNYGLKAAFVNMVVEKPSATFDRSNEIDVLWVGNIRPVKRPDIVLEMASSLPQLRFVMIGGPTLGSEQYYSQIKEKAEAIGNLEFLGAVPYRDVTGFFAKARVFINTSDLEGFPNTFLQSWVNGVPVISFFDPDNVIKNRNLGFSPAGPEEMFRILQDLTANDDSRRELSRRVKEYALEHHSPQSILKQHIEAFAKAFS